MAKKVFKISKLVRNKIYTIMTDGGATMYQKDNLTQEELIQVFKNKIVEEALEVREALSRENLLEELADVQDVLQGFLKALKVSDEEFDTIRQQKIAEKGSYDTPCFIDKVEVDSEHDYAKYYSLRPDKYPVVE